MFTPLNIKKLTNVSIVTLKKYGHKYELALYPNKLYEYQHNITKDIDQILHTRTIYSSVSKGAVCSRKNLECFNMTDDQIIEYILKHGTEQKNIKTRNVEQQIVERQISEYLSKKLMLNGKMLSMDKLLEIVKKRVVQINRDPKVQAQDILKELCKNGYDVVPLVIRIRNNEKFIEDFKNYEIKNQMIIMKWSDFKDFKKIADKNKILFEIVENEIEDEEIC
ncbi:Ribosome maturation protein SDO1 [Dictyocoela muelleri]|nr:Ribosome maturation protein SDO1 [Dictyocoela muelleri]